MIQHYITWLYPNAMSPGETTLPVADRTPPEKRRIGAQGYRFRERKEVLIYGEVFHSDFTNVSPFTWYGHALTLNQVRALPGTKALQEKMIQNEWERVVQTIYGHFHPLYEGDIVIEEQSTVGA